MRHKKASSRSAEKQKAEDLYSISSEDGRNDQKSKAAFLRKGLPKASSTPSRPIQKNSKTNIIYKTQQSTVTTNSVASNVKRYNPLQRNPGLMKDLNLIHYLPSSKSKLPKRHLDFKIQKARAKALLIARAPFYRVLKQHLVRATQDFPFINRSGNHPSVNSTNNVNRITVSAVELMQEVTEMLLVFLVEDVNRVALHCGRVTIMAKDFHIVSEIRKSFGLNFNTKF